MFYLIALLVVLADQATKYAIRSHVDVGASLTVGGLRITHYENSGMAGSLFQGYGTLFGVAALLFVAGVLYYRRTVERRSMLLECSLGFLVGGAVGNGIDRMLYGQVTDFLVRKGGILNVADHAIEAGVVLLLLHAAAGWLKKTRRA